jgi:hypothetical protein
MVMEILLSQGAIALVDDADYASAIAVDPWCLSDCGGHMYAQHAYTDQFGMQRTIRMHTFLTRWTLVDHVNGDGLDNRRVNLRPAMPSENSANQRLSRANSSGFKGVHLYKRTGKWRAYISAGGVARHIGYFATPEDAARAYDAEAIATWGEYARPNFPQEQSA